MIEKIKVYNNKLRVKKPAVIFAFPGVGLVGSIVGKYLVEQLKIPQIGYVESPHLPPVSFIQNGQVYDAIRIYESKKDNFLIVTSEFPVPQNIIFDLGESLTNWCKDIKAKKIICVEGIKTKDEKEIGNVMVITSNKNVKHDSDLKEMDKGYILGVSASLMLKSKKHGLPAVCYLVQSHTEYPDGLAAVGLLKNFNKEYNLNLNLVPLETEATMFEKKLTSMVSKAKQLTSDHLKTNDQLNDKDNNVMFG